MKAYIMRKLTNKQEAFINEYMINGFNATNAYMSAFKCKSENTGRSNGSKLLNNVNVKKEIDERRERIKEKSELNQERLLSVLSTIIQTDITTIATIKEREETREKLDMSTGDITEEIINVKYLDIKKTEEMNDNEKACIKGYKLTRYGIEPVFYDKLDSIKIAVDILGLGKKDTQINATLSVPDNIANMTNEQLMSIIKGGDESDE